MTTFGCRSIAGDKNYQLCYEEVEAGTRTEGRMKYRAIVLALLCMSTPALADCQTPAYVGLPGSRGVSAAMILPTAALTVLTLPAGAIGVATRNEALINGTRDTFCYTTGFAGHAIVGHR
jgi:hypothetical protein